MGTEAQQRAAESRQPWPEDPHLCRSRQISCTNRLVPPYSPWSRPINPVALSSSFTTGWICLTRSSRPIASLDPLQAGQRR